MSEPVQLGRVRMIRDIDHAVASIRVFQGELQILMDALEGAPPERVRPISRKMGAASAQSCALAITSLDTLRRCLLVGNEG